MNELESSNQNNLDQDYFYSYEDIKIHEIMLKDTPRNEAYRNAIVRAKKQIEGKVVLDVGTGTGILAVLCEKVGAAKVYAVEASNLAKVAEDVIKENECKNIEIIQSRIEDVKLSEKVDVIISEWMGFYLLHEGMLDSVLFARDNFLKPDGLILPCQAKIYAAPCRLPTMFDFWNDVSGVSMKIIGQICRSWTAKKPEICVVESKDLLADAEVIMFLNLYDITCEELNNIEFEHIFVTKIEAMYQGLCLWFEVDFLNDADDIDFVTLGTGPEDKITHWKQTVIVLPQEISVEVGYPIACNLHLNRCSENNRRYNIEFEMKDAFELEHPIGCGCYMTKCIVTKAFLERQDNMVETTDIKK